MVHFISLLGFEVAEAAGLDLQTISFGHKLTNFTYLSITTTNDCSSLQMLSSNFRLSDQRHSHSLLAFFNAQLDEC